MPEPLYGAKCGRCSHLVHDGERASEVIPWLPKPAGVLLWCDDCDFCQDHALHVLIRDIGTDDLFGPEVRAAVKAFHDGTEHPLLDQLRAECQAIENEGTSGHIGGEAKR